MANRVKRTAQPAQRGRFTGLRERSLRWWGARLQGPWRPVWVLFVGAFAGVVLVTVALLLLWLLTETVLPRWYGDAFTESEGENRLQLVLAFSQLYGGFVALWAAGVVGWYAYDQFHRETAEPRLRLLAYPPRSYFVGPGGRAALRALHDKLKAGEGDVPLRFAIQRRRRDVGPGLGGYELAPATAGSDRRAGGGPVQLEIDLLNTGDAEADHWRVQFGASPEWLNPPPVIRPDAVSSEGEKPLFVGAGHRFTVRACPGLDLWHPGAEAPTPGAPKEWKYLASVPYTIYTNRARPFPGSLRFAVTLTLLGEEAPAGS